MLCQSRECVIMTSLITGEECPLVKIGDHTTPKNGYMSICQSHVTKYKWHHNHLQRDAPGFLSKKWIYCPNFVNVVSLIMVLEMLKRYSVFSIFFELTERQHVAEGRSENLKTTSALCFYTFFIILLNFNKSNFLEFLLFFPWIIDLSKDFF